MSCAKEAVEAVENCVYVKVDEDQDEAAIDAVVESQSKRAQLEHHESVGSIQGALVQKGSPDRGNGASGESLSIRKHGGRTAGASGAVVRTASKLAIAGQDVIQFFRTEYLVHERAGTARIDVERSGLCADALEARWTNANVTLPNEAFVEQTGVVRFAPGASTAHLELELVHHVSWDVEGVQILTLALDQGCGAQLGELFETHVVVLNVDNFPEASTRARRRARARPLSRPLAHHLATRRAPPRRDPPPPPLPSDPPRRAHAADSPPPPPLPLPRTGPRGDGAHLRPRTRLLGA